MNFGPATEEPDSWAIMDRALDAGVNFFDTANVYGRAFWTREPTGHAGLTEEIIGRWLAQGGRRERIVLATKVYGDMRTVTDEPDRASGLSARRIILDCEDSLRRLQTDYIDLYQMHHTDRDCPVDEVLEAFHTLKRQGKIVYMGSSNFAGWDIARYAERARQLGSPGLVTEQSVYSLQNRAIESELVPACRHYGIAILPYSPLAGGLLAGVRAGADSGKTARRATRTNDHADQVARYEAFCKDLGAAPATVALAWVLHNPVVAAPIIGPRTMEQFTSTLAATELKLDAQALAALDDIWPGPGEAPKNYAW